MSLPHASAPPRPAMLCHAVPCRLHSHRDARAVCQPRGHLQGRRRRRRQPRPHPHRRLAQQDCCHRGAPRGRRAGGVCGRRELAARRHPDAGAEKDGLSSNHNIRNLGIGRALAPWRAPHFSPAHPAMPCPMGVCFHCPRALPFHVGLFFMHSMFACTVIVKASSDSNQGTPRQCHSMGVAVQGKCRHKAGAGLEPKGAWRASAQDGCNVGSGRGTAC